MTKEKKHDDPSAFAAVKVDKKGKVDYSTMGQNFNDAISHEVDDIKSVGGDALHDELKKYGFLEGGQGSDPAWIASKVRALHHAQLAEHELTPEGYKQML